jgi:hypothetical protein
MRKSIRAELHLLREMAHDFLRGKTCYFCHRPLVRDLDQTFGDKANSALRVDLTVHHLNENHDDNRPANRAWVHAAGHRAYHAFRTFHRKSMCQARSLAAARCLDLDCRKYHRYRCGKPKRCEACGGTIPPRTPYYYQPRTGRVVCARCHQEKPHVRSIIQ